MLLDVQMTCSPGLRNLSIATYRMTKNVTQLEEELCSMHISIFVLGIVILGLAHHPGQDGPDCLHGVDEKGSLLRILFQCAVAYISAKDNFALLLFSSVAPFF